MRIETGEIEGPLVVSDELHLMGMASGPVTVRDGGVLHLGGTALQGLVIERGGSASVLGSLTGAVHNSGLLEVSGIVRGHITTDPDAATHIAAGAVVVDD